jgi:hypothetical protein
VANLPADAEVAIERADSEGASRKPLAGAEAVYTLEISPAQ